MEIVVCLVFKEKSEAFILVFKWKHNMSLSIFLSYFLYVLSHAYVSSGLDGQK
jgi:hypothetical protein